MVFKIVLRRIEMRVHPHRIQFGVVEECRLRQTMGLMRNAGDRDRVPTYWRWEYLVEDHIREGWETGHWGVVSFWVVKRS